jgi:TM2 domain-containing membrane protein YozV
MDMTGLLLAIFLGWAGGYRFYKKQTVLGILYLLTFGLFGIGWLVDIYQAIRAMMKINTVPNVLNSTVVDPHTGMDIGALPSEVSKTIRSQFQDAKLSATLTKRNMDYPEIALRIER